jgi:signal transduction histidine kinase
MLPQNDCRLHPRLLLLIRAGWLCLVAWWLAVHGVGAQNLNTDSLFQRFRLAPNDSLKVSVLKYTESYAKEHPEQTLEFLHKAHIYAKKELQDRRLQANILNHLMKVYWVLGDHNKSFQYSWEEYQLSQALGDKKLEMNALINIAIHQDIVQAGSPAAVDYNQKALALAKYLKDTSSLIAIYNNISDFLRKQQNYDSAIYYAQQALTLAQKLKLKDDEGFSYLNIGEILLNQKRYLGALKYLSVADSLLAIVNNNFDRAYTLMLLGQLHRENNNLTQSEKFLRNALEVSQKIQSKYDMVEIYLQLYFTAEQKADLKAALHYYKQYKAYSDSVRSENQIRELAKMQSQFAAREREKEIEELRKISDLQEQQLSKQRTITIAVTALALLFFAFMVTVFFSKKQLEKRNRAILEQQKEIQRQRENIRLQNDELSAKNQELTDLNQEKNLLIGIVAHDLRSPINRMKGWLTLFKLVSGEMNEEQQSYLGQVMETLESLGVMIGKILDAESIESNKLNIRLEKANIIELVTDVVENFDKVADAKAIRLNTSLAGIPIEVVLDKNYFTQVLENLLSNAIKFSERKSTVSVKTVVHDHQVAVWVEDQGPGFSEEDLRKVFGKFQRLSAQPTGGETSTGLGLSIVKRYVLAMNGQIRCENRDDERGARFIVSFRLADQS